MPLTDVQICNMALGHIGHTKFIAALTDRSNEASVLNQFYEQARDFSLECFPWPFAKKTVTLGLVTDYTVLDTIHEWSYAYRYPDDCLFARYILTANGRMETDPPPFEVGSDDSGRLIFTDQEDAILVYTRRVTDPALFTAAFGESVSWWLSGLICPGLAKDKKQAQGCFQMFQALKPLAEARSGNEQQQSPELDSEFIRARQ